MTILVIGATGSVGRPGVAGLLAKGESVRALSRSADNLAKLPIEEAIRNSGDDFDARAKPVKAFLPAWLSWRADANASG